MIRRSRTSGLRAALAAALLPLAASAQDTGTPKDAWTFSGEGRHYSIRSTAAKERAQAVLKYMDLCYETYSRFLRTPADAVPRRKFTLVLYSSLEEYQARGGTGRYGHYDGSSLVAYDHPDQMLATFAHEGMHQFTDFCIPNFDRLPSWYAEGIAECIANNEVRNGRLMMCLKKGPVPRLRVPVVQEAIRTGTHVRFRDLFDLDKRRFEHNHQLLYAESWSLCHFLLTAPKHEDPDKQIPDGKYKQIVQRFHGAMTDPKTSAADAVKSAFTMNGKPVDLDALEKEWADYMLRFPVEDEPERKK